MLFFFFNLCCLLAYLFGFLCIFFSQKWRKFGISREKQLGEREEAVGSWATAWDSGNPWQMCREGLLGKWRAAPSISFVPLSGPLPLHGKVDSFEGRDSLAEFGVQAAPSAHGPAKETRRRSE